MRLPRRRQNLDLLLRTFNESGVDYLIIGSVAKSHYRYVHGVDDLDLLVSPTLENSERVVRAIHEVNCRIFGCTKAIDPYYFSKPRRKSEKHPDLWADILTPVESFSFCDAFSRSIEIQVFDDVRARIVSERDLDRLDEFREQRERDDSQERESR